MREGRAVEDGGVEVDIYGLYEMVRYNGFLTILMNQSSGGRGM